MPAVQIKPNVSTVCIVAVTFRQQTLLINAYSLTVFARELTNHCWVDATGPSADLAE